MLRLTKCQLSAVALFTLCLAGCGQTSTSNQAGALALPPQGQPVRPSSMKPFMVLQLRQDIADKINQLEGLQNTIVLQEGRKAYVGTYLRSGVPEKPGFLNGKTQMTIRSLVVRALPDVRTVLITTDPASSDLLWSYANYMRAGGDMQRSMGQFHDRIARIWPHGKGVAPDRPSASPNFVPTPMPADHHTTDRPHVGQ